MVKAVTRPSPTGYAARVRAFAVEGHARQQREWVIEEIKTALISLGRGNAESAKATLSDVLADLEANR